MRESLPERARTDMLAAAMISPSECLQRAFDYENRAAAASSVKERIRLLTVAVEWLELALLAADRPEPSRRILH